MTVSELVSRWSEEERRRHADLIAECLYREKMLIGIEKKSLGAEDELAKGLDLLLDGLKNLSRKISRHADQMEEIYLRAAKGEGNA